MDRFRGIVRDLSHKGLGVIDHPDGRVFFCRGTWPGDEGIFEVSPSALKYSEAILIEILIPSKARVKSPCPHQGNQPGKCGGCPWMKVAYDEQLKYKTKRLLHALEKRRINLSEEVLRSIIASPEILGYRNRVQIKSDGENLGYISEGSRTLAPVDECLVMNERLRDLYRQLKGILPRDDLRPGENHHWFYMDLDDEMSLSELTPNKRRPFRQGNTSQNQRMRSWIREKISSVPKHYPVIDLYSGSGNFTEILSEENFENILAVEVQGVALDSLKRKNLPGVRVLGEDLSGKGAWARVAKLQPHAKVIIADPAREGILKRRNFIKAFDNLETLIYVSCELDSFSRDAADIVKAGFELTELTPLDLFPHTSHVEILSVFRRVSKR